MLNSFNYRKGTGPDSLSPALLKFISGDISPGLAQIFKHSIETSFLPLDWKLANVVPIFKKSDKKLSFNYKPISLTSVSSKLIEHIIAHKIKEYLDKNNLLSEG